MWPHPARTLMMVHFSLVPAVLLLYIPRHVALAEELVTENQASSSTRQARKKKASATTDCKHGTFDNKSQVCICDKGWVKAGVTDTVDFLQGVCEQFQCQSDSQCQDVL